MVDDVGCSAEGINPKAKRKMRMENEGQTDFCHMLVFSFNAAILGGGIGARELMMNTRGAKVGFEAIACKLNTTITLKNFDASGMLVFNKILKVNKDVIKFRF